MAATLRDVTNLNDNNNNHLQQRLHQDAACNNNSSSSTSTQPQQQQPSQQQQPPVIATTITPAMMPPLPAQREPRPEDEYGDEIYDHLFARQHSNLRDASYLSRQREVEERMRIILMDWLVDVAIKFRQRPETFFLAVDIVDRYLMLQQVSRANLQLVGITAVLIAAKHEEIWAPEVRECSQITANTYSKEDIIRVEREICGALRYRFTLPTPFTFAIRLVQFAETEIAYNTNLDHLVFFFLELSSLHYAMLNWRPSTVALAAFLLARITWHHRALLSSQGFSDICLPIECADEWIPEYLDETSRKFCHINTIEDIAPAVRELLSFALTASQPDYRFRAVQRKYSHDKYGNVSREPMILPPLDVSMNQQQQEENSSNNNNNQEQQNQEDVPSQQVSRASSRNGTQQQQQQPSNNNNNNCGDTHLDEDSNMSSSQ